MAPKNLFISVCFAIVTMISVAAVPAPVLAAPSAALQEHTIKFYLDPALVSDMDFAKMVLVKYVADMNMILSKNTSRHLLFNPNTDIIVTASQPHSNQAIPPLPNDGFEIWAHAIHTDYAISYGGYAGIDDSGAGVLAGLNWTRLYNPDALQSGEVLDYWTQINNMLHELAHVFGAGIGEYYKLAVVQDTTGETPNLPINIFDANDSFWSTKPDFMTDPLLKNAAQSDALGQSVTRQALLAYVKYSDLTAKIISDGYRNGIPVNELSQITLKIVSDDTGLPLEDVQVNLWSVQGGSPYESHEIVEGTSDLNGELKFAWNSSSADPHNSYDFLRLMKFHKDGYQPAAQYISIFDGDIATLVDGAETWTITVHLKELEDIIPLASSFDDVTTDNFAWLSIEQLYSAKITGGCSTSPLMYCPDQTVTRGQMAVFLERSMKGSGFVPPSGTNSFQDTSDHWAQAWIEVLAVDGITSGCGNGNYCPDQPVTRGQMAIFLLRAKYGKDYVPPAPTGTMFQDVPQDHWAAAWIEQFSAEGITSGCGNGNFCPDQPVTRAQMAVFLSRSFKLH